MVDSSQTLLTSEMGLHSPELSVRSRARAYAQITLRRSHMTNYRFCRLWHECALLVFEYREKGSLHDRSILYRGAVS